LRERPDLVVSGMNYGANLGRVALMSGTVGAAMTAASAGLPAIAISVGAPDGATEPTLKAFPDAAELTERFIRTIVARPGSLPAGRLLNVNYPAVPRTNIRGMKATSQAASFSKKRTYRLVATPMLRPGARRFVVVRTGGVRPDDLGTEDQDVRAFDAGWITVTPMDGDWTDASEIPAVNDLIRELPLPGPRQ
jgi:5'-nucleotidase